MKTSFPVLASVNHSIGVLFCLAMLASRAWADSGATYTYAATNDFGAGLLVNLNYTNSQAELRLNTQTVPFKFLNVPCSVTGTVVRLDVTTTNVVGEYRTAPQGKPSFPGHTVVDRYGNTWVANWGEAGNLDGTTNGSITRIGIVIGGTRGDVYTNANGVVTNFVANTNGSYLKPPFIYSTAVDRDGDGYIKTSHGLGDILDWPTNTVGGVAGSLQNAEDECIINYVRVPAQLVSALALDANNDLWVGGYCHSHSQDYGGSPHCGNRLFVKVDGLTGQVLTNQVTFLSNSIAYGGFEALITPNGWLWSSGGANDGPGTRSLAVYDPVAQWYCIATNLDQADFGMAIDPQTGNLWVSSYDDANLAVFGMSTNGSWSWLTNFPHGDSHAGGLAIDNDGNVWVAHGPWGGEPTVAHLRTDGTFITNVNLSTPDCANSLAASTVAIDANGKVWAVCASQFSQESRDARVFRIDPALDQADLCLGLTNKGDCEAYGDLTGQNLLAGTAPAGVWSLVCTNGATNQCWYSASWTGSDIDTNQVRVEVRAANQITGLSSNAFQVAGNGVPLTNLTGQYLEMRVTLMLAALTNSPALHDLTLTAMDPAPGIITQPANQYLCPGSTATFGVTATGTLPLSYQWRFNGASLAGANQTSLTLTNVQATNAGSYTAVITNAYGSVTSAQATLTVWTNIAITAAPANTNVCAGWNATFSVAASGTISAYQWYKGSSGITGQTNSSLVLTNISAGDAGTYRVLVSGPCNSTNLYASLALHQNVVVTNAPVSLTNRPGTTATFIVGASGTISGYQWSKGTNVLAGQTNSSLVLSNVTAADAGTYWVTVNGPCNSTNAYATLTVQCTLSPDGLVGWWQGEDNGYEAMGANNAALYGVTFTNGEVGAAFRFDGWDSSAYAYVPAGSNLDIGKFGGLTVECWIAPNDTYTWGALAAWDDVWGDFGMVFGVNCTDAGALSVSFLDANWNYYSLSSTGGVLTAGSFQHVAVTYDQTNGAAVLYCNGNIVAADTLGSFTLPASADLFFGFGIDWNNWDYLYYSGRLDEMGVYNRALDASEIRAIYDAGSLGRCGIAPSWIVQPASHTATEGNSVVLHSLAAGTSLHYQWRTNGSPISGATSPQYTLPSVQTSDAGTYSVQVSNAVGTITSSNAVLTVNPAVCYHAPTGLISWWRAETNANDSVGTNHGILRNGASFAAGKTGGGFYFDGINQCVAIPWSPSLVPTNYTVETWIKPLGDVSWQVLLFGQANGSQLVAWPGSTWGRIMLALRYNWWWAELESNTEVGLGEWTHLAGSWDGVTLRLYINGVLDATNQPGVTIWDSGCPLYIGGFYATNGPCGTYADQFFSGLMDEVSFYNRALSDEEIQGLYNASIAGKCQDPPAITVQPANQNVGLGSNATFTVSATGTPQLRYQWRFSGTNLSGATLTSLTLTSVQSTQAGTYSVLVTNAFGSALSSNAVLTITNLTLPVVSILYPTNRSLTNAPLFVEPTHITFTVSNFVSGGTISQVQLFWHSNYTNICIWATNTPPSSFNFTWSNLLAGIYAVTAVATDNRGAAASSEILVFEVGPSNPPPSVWIVWPTNNATFPAGANITIVAEATNSALPAAVVTNVEFFASTRRLGADPDRPFSLTECCWTAGKYVLRAKATDNLGASSNSVPVEITVLAEVPGAGNGFWDPTFTIPESTVRVTCTAVSGSNLYCAAFPESDWSHIYRWDGASWLDWDPFDLGGAQAIPAMTANETGVYYADINDNDLRIWRKNGDGVVALGDNCQLTCSTWGNPWYRPLCLRVIGSDLYLGGDFWGNAPGLQYLAKWNPATDSWDPVGEVLDGPVFAIESFEGDLVAGGRFGAAGLHTNLCNIARLHEGVWVPLGTGVVGTNSAGDESGVYSLASCGTNLFVGGDFTTAGDIPNVNGIALWNGQTWQAVGQGVGAIPSQEEGWMDFPNPMVANLSARGNCVFVSGKFTAIWDQASNAIGVSGVAKVVWSEAQQQWIWSDLDLGVYKDNYAPGAYCGIVGSMHAIEGTNAGAYDVVVGGWFSFAGAGMTNLLLNNQPHYYQGLARWRVGEGPPTNAPRVSISYPDNYALFTNNPTSITVTAMVSSVTNVVSVEFYADGAILGTDTTYGANSYTQTWANPTTGLHLLKAIATDANGLRGESRAVLISLKNATNAITARDDSFAIPQGSGDVVLLVLTNDTPATGLRISRLFQTRGSLGTTTISWDGRSISFIPFPNLYGTNQFAYTVTNSSGASDSAWVTISLQARPRVRITSPCDGDAFGTSDSVSLIASAFDYDGQVTNLALLVNGLELAHTGSGAISAAWNTNAPGFYTFIAQTADNDGLTNQSSLVTIVVTNTTPSPNGPIAAINNLVDTVTTQNSFTSVAHTVVHEGLFDLEGTARDPDGDPVAYAVLLFRPEDLDFTISGELKEALEVAEPYADLTPEALNPQGFHNGAVTNASLGTLGFTRFPNGAYYLVLRVRGGTDETNAVVQFQLDTQLKIGQFSFSEQDLVIPANGIPLTVTRTYNSLNPRSADFGYSWTYSLMGMDVQLDDERQDVTVGTDQAPFADEEEDNNGLPRTVSMRVGGGWDVTLNLPDGRRTTFAFGYTGAWPELYAKWTAPDDAHATLTMLGNNKIVFGTSGLQLPTWADSDLSYGRAPFENQDIEGWILQTQDGTKYEIGRGEADNVVYQQEPGVFESVRAYGKPTLRKITQRSGDTITIEDNGIFHYAAGPNGTTTTDLTRSVLFDRDSQGRITAIRDPNSGSNGLPVLKYVYHGQNGNLLQVLRLTDRAAGTYVATKYHYDHPKFTHYITSMENPLGVPVARNEYDDSGRLTAVVDADGKRTEFHHSTSNSVEVVIDRLGHTNSYAYDSRGNVTATTNVLGQVTLMAYDDKNQKTAETNAFGTTRATWTLYGCDDKGNQTNVVDTLDRTNSFAYDDYGNLLAHRDPLGTVTRNFYDDAGNLTNTVVRDSQGNIVEQTFSLYQVGHLVETRNGTNQVTAKFYYDASGNLTNTVDANNFSRTFTYDANGNQTGSSYVWFDPGGAPHTVTTSTEYDAAGRVTQAVDGDGNTNLTFYTAGGKVDYTIDKLGNTNSFLYDERGNLVQTTYPDGTVTRTVYNEDAKPFLTADRNGITGTRTDFDALGRATNVVRLTNVVINVQAAGDGIWSSSIGNGGVPISSNLTEYYDNGWVKSRTGADGQKTSYDYWPDGQLMTVTDARTNVTYYEYDAGGRQRLIGDALNHTNHFEYDAVGRLRTTIFANGSYTSNYFNGLGQRTVQVDQARLATQFGYDVSGQLTNVIKPPVPDPESNYATNSPAWSYQYDAYGRLTVTTDPRHHATTNVYDALGRQIGQSFGGHTNWLRYNGKGQLWQQFDFKGQKTEYVYDRYGRVKAKFLFAAAAAYPSNAVCYLYNRLGQLTNIVERSGEGVTTNVCDGYAALVGPPGGAGAPASSRLMACLARVPAQGAGALAGLALFALVVASLPREMKRRLAIGARTFLSAETEPAAVTRRLRLPGLGWRFATIVTVIALVGSDPAYDRLWTARADCSIPANTSTETERYTYFAYDVEGRLTQINSPEGVINYGYDLATGRHISTCTAKSEFQYAYDELGRLKTVQVLKRNGGSVSETTTYTYTKVGNRETVTLPNGVLTTYRYDDLNRLTNMTHVAGTTNLASYTYQLHSTGRRTNAVEVLRQQDDTYLTNTFTWQYDGLYRLTNEVLLCSESTHSYTNAYEYDQAGNRFKKLRIASAGTTTITNAYDASDRLLQEVTLANGTYTTNAYAYDDNGSLIEKQEITGSGTTTTTYAYNLANKLSSVTSDAGTTSFLYNDSGIRVRSWGTSGSPTLYLVDANNHTGYAQVLEELNTLGGTPTMSYVLGDDVLAQSSSSSASYLLYDGHGSTRQLVSSTLSVTSKYNYDAYGVALDNCYNPSGTSLQYCGEQFDTALQMYNLRARYYSPANGRFNQADTYRGDSFDPQSLHKYQYCGGDAVNVIDPSGQFGVLDILSTVGIMLTVVALMGITAKIYRGVKQMIQLDALAIDMAKSDIDPIAQLLLRNILLKAFTRSLSQVLVGVVEIATMALIAIATSGVASGLVGMAGEGAGAADGALVGAKFAQRYIHSAREFTEDGMAIYSRMTGRTIRTVDDLVKAIKDGVVKVEQIRVDYIVRDGNTLILNTRTAVALERAHIPRSQWAGRNVTGLKEGGVDFEELLTNQLTRPENALGSEGIEMVTIGKGGPPAF